LALSQGVGPAPGGFVPLCQPSKPCGVGEGVGGCGGILADSVTGTREIDPPGRV